MFGYVRPPAPLGEPARRAMCAAITRGLAPFQRLRATMSPYAVVARMSS